MGHDVALRTLSALYNHHDSMTHHPVGIMCVLVQVYPADVASTRLERPPLYGACAPDVWKRWAFSAEIMWSQLSWYDTIRKAEDDAHHIINDFQAM